jgi:regulator of protease activity HflC (stomatin/prohibitin superfamily)
MGGVALLVFIVIGLILFIIGLILRGKYKLAMAERKEPQRNRYGDVIRPTNISPYFIWSGIGLAALCGIIFLVSCFKIIDAGEVGLQVKFGRVMDKTLTEGFNTKSPFAKVYTYGIRLKEYTMSVAHGEGQKEGPDQVEVRSSDNSRLDIDGTIWWAVDPQSAFDIYKKVSQNEKGLQDMIIRPAIRGVMRDVAATYTMERLMQDRQAYGDEVLTAMREAVAGKGVVIDRVLIRNISPPEAVDLAIEAKLSAEQDLQKLEFERQQAEKRADIREIEATGVANAQDIIQQKLTPLYVQYDAIQAYKELAGSPNTTFVIMPTSPNGAGIPIIIDAQGMAPSVQPAGQ